MRVNQLAAVPRGNTTPKTDSQSVDRSFAMLANRKPLWTVVFDYTDYDVGGRVIRDGNQCGPPSPNERLSLHLPRFLRRTPRRGR